MTVMMGPANCWPRMLLPRILPTRLELPTPTRRWREAGWHLQIQATALPLRWAPASWERLGAELGGGVGVGACGGLGVAAGGGGVAGAATLAIRTVCPDLGEPASV
jgi:hypothetical protein